MVLYIVRHGKPDYKSDTLLPEGWEQARLVAKRLAVSGIDEIYASPMGRAVQTAQPTAELLGLPVTVEPWAHELGAESHTLFPDGVEKIMSGVQPALFYAPENMGLTAEESLEKVQPFRDFQFPERYKAISDGLDDLLARCGYKRNSEGTYDVITPNDKHIALFCHCGMGRVLMSHIYSIPYQFVASAWVSNFTGVTALYFENNAPKIIPRLFSYGDVGHLYAEGKPLPHMNGKVEY